MKHNWQNSLWQEGLGQWKLMYIHNLFSDEPSDQKVPNKTGKTQNVPTMSLVTRLMHWYFRV